MGHARPWRWAEAIFRVLGRARGRGWHPRRRQIRCGVVGRLGGKRPDGGRQALGSERVPGPRDGEHSELDVGGDSDQGMSRPKCLGRGRGEDGLAEKHDYAHTRRVVGSEAGRHKARKADAEHEIVSCAASMIHV